MDVCILDQSGEILVHRNMQTTPEAFLQASAPYRQGIVVAKVSRLSSGMLCI